MRRLRAVYRRTNAPSAHGLQRDVFCRTHVVTHSRGGERARKLLTDLRIKGGELRDGKI